MARCHTKYLRQRSLTTAALLVSCGGCQFVKCSRRDTVLHLCFGLVRVFVIGGQRSRKVLHPDFGAQWESAMQSNMRHASHCRTSMSCKPTCVNYKTSTDVVKTISSPSDSPVSAGQHNIYPQPQPNIVVRAMGFSAVRSASIRKICALCLIVFCTIIYWSYRKPTFPSASTQPDIVRHHHHEYATYILLPLHIYLRSR